MPVVTKAANAHTIVTTGWTNPSNAFATTGNNVYATAAPAKNATINGDFGFPDFATGDIPDGATINSVTVTVEWKLSGTQQATLGVQLRNNGVALGSETTYASTTEAQSTQQVTSGISLTDLRSASSLIKARVRDSRGNTNTAHTGSLDFVSLSVDYTEAPPAITSTASWAQAAGSWAAQAAQALDATASFAQVAASWDAEAVQSLDAAATFAQAPASWDATAEAPIVSDATFAQAAAGWDADATVGEAAITSDATWDQAAAGWVATADQRNDLAASFAQAAAGWAAEAGQALDAVAAFAQPPAAWASQMDAPVVAAAVFVQGKAGWSASVNGGIPSNGGPWLSHGVIHLGHVPRH